MKRFVAVVAVVVSVGSLAGPAGAQPAPQGREHTRLGSWIGDWSVVEELRDAPAGAPYEFVGTAQCRWLPGGYQIEWRQKGVVKGQELHGLEIDSFDYVRKVYVAWWWNSDGSMGHASFPWTGNSYSLDFTDSFPDGKEVKSRCTWTFAADLRTATGSCDKLTDGKWWTFRKAKLAKTGL